MRFAGVFVLFKDVIAQDDRGNMLVGVALTKPQRHAVLACVYKMGWGSFGSNCYSNEVFGVGYLTLGNNMWHAFSQASGEVF